MNFNRAKQFRFMVLTVLVAVLVFTLGISTMSMAQGAKPQVINAQTFGDPSTIKIGWAQGWFDEATGVVNKWVSFDTGADVIMAMTAGSLDISSLGSTPTTVALARRAPISIIAVEMDIADNEALIVRQGINVVQDLIGKKIATPFSSTSHYALMRLLKIYNIKPSQLQIIDMGSMESASAFQTGSIDGAWVWDPAYTAMIKAGGHILMASGAVGKMGYPTWNNIVVRNEFAKKYPDVTVNWLRAFLRTVDYYYKNPEDSAKIVGKRLGAESEPTLKMMKGFGFPTGEEQISPQWLGTPGKPGLVAKGTKDTSEFLVDQKAVPKPLEMNQCIEATNPSYLIKAMKK